VKRFAADLHIHTALSPCASEEMTPSAIVDTAVQRGLAMIAVCDHNSAGNVAAVQQAAGNDIAVLVGMEITTSEEAHVIGLFPDAAAASAASQAVRETLPDVDPGTRRRFGDQVLMDAQGRIVGDETKLLAAASGLSLSESVHLIKRHGGIAVAAHIDRPSFSVLSQLGVFPVDAGFDAVEVSAVTAASARSSEFASFNLPVVTGSDAHFLSDIGICRTVFEMSRPTFEELVGALKETGGRRIYHA
jgi:predicted metal-dependent phosphoesterase TrpH